MKLNPRGVTFEIAQGETLGFDRPREGILPCRARRVFKTAATVRYYGTHSWQHSHDPYVWPSLPSRSPGWAPLKTRA